jgi:hypothetical protein
MAYAPPCCTASRICIGISNNRVYLIVDDTFYPPIPGLTIPAARNVYGLARFGCRGIKTSIRSLTNRWSEDRLADGTMAGMRTNPLAHMLFLAERKTRTCPHYHAHKRTEETRDAFGSIMKNDADVNLPADILRVIGMIRLAGEPCTNQSCSVPQKVRDEIGRIIQEANGQAPQ